MEKEYVRIQWENRPSITTPLGQINLNKMDYQIDKNENTLITFDTTKANQSDLLQTIRTLTYDTETGIFVFTFWNGSTYSVDLNIEKIPVTFSMDEYGVITMTTADGTTYTCDIGALIKLYTFVDGDEIDFVTTTDAGGNKTITASIKDGSIVGSKLQPNFLADCQAAKAQAELAATSASSDASDAELSSEDSEAWAVGERNGQPVPSTDPAYENNAKWWAQHGTGSSFAGLTDTNFTNLQNGQIAKYNSTTQKWENTEDEGGLLPHFKITSESGSTVTVVCPDTSVIVPTQTSSGIWQCDVPAYGVYTVHAVINGDDAVRTVTVDTVKEYVIHDEHYSYTLNVYAPTGSSILVTDGGSETYTGTGAGSTAVIFALHQASTTYTITVDYDGLDSSTTITSSATSGGSGSKTITFGTINLTLDEDLIGETIVMTKGLDTVSKVASSTSMVFYPNATGNWTISCQYDGETYYSEPNPVVVSSLSTAVSAEISLVHIPEGATVLPTDDIQTWLACANITNKSYTTLREVLADRETFETLIADSNACDYMARSTSWALAEGLVPTMTSDTTPSGECKIGGTNSSAYLTFDDDKETCGDPSFGNTGNVTNSWYQYKFESPVKVKFFDISQPRHVQNYWGRTFKVQYSNDGTTFTDITSSSFDMSEGESLTGVYTKRFTIDDDITALYWRIQYLTSFNSIKVLVGDIQFYEDADITHSQDAMALIGRYDYCSNTLLSNATWAEAIANSDYFEEVLNVKVPVMMSDTTPSGVCSASSVFQSGSEAYRSFDKNETTWWHSAAGVPQWLEYQFTSDVNVKLVTLKTATTVGGPKTSKIQYYDGSEWKDYSDDASFVDCPTLGTTYSKIYNTNISASRFRLYVTESNYTYQGNQYAVLAELQFYGRASEEVLVPLVPTMTSNTTPSGTCIRSSVYSSGYEAFKAFDNNTSTWWNANGGAGEWIGYTFTRPVVANKLYLYALSTSKVGTIKVQASNDGFISDIHDISSDFTPSSFPYNLILENNTAYSSYRIINISGTTDFNVYELQFYQRTVQTNIIHSAPNDYIYMLEDGVPTPICRANENGDAIFDFSELEEGVYTFGSTTAKNPNDLSEDFKKRFRITKTPYGGTTERYLLPDTIDTLYWYGYEDNNLEDASASNGWSGGSGGQTGTYQAPTHNTTDILCNSSGNYVFQGVGSKKAIVDMKSLHSVMLPTRGAPSDKSQKGYLRVSTSKSYETMTQYYNFATLELERGDINISDTNSLYIFNGEAWGAQGYVKSLWYDRVSNDIPTFISAANDTLYIMDGNTKVYIANTNGEGKSYEPLLEAGTYTIYSSVAKDPNNLSNPYSKTVTVDESTQTIAVMPDAVKTLYWWGYVGDNLENASSANGWSWSGRSFVDPTYNTHDIQLSTGSGQIAIVGNKNAISCSKVYSIARATNDGLEMKTSTSKNVVTSITGTTSTSSSTNSLLQVSQTVTNGYVTIICQNTQVGYASAFWYE